MDDETNKNEKFTSKFTSRLGHVRPKRYRTRYSEYVHEMKNSRVDREESQSEKTLTESKELMSEGTQEQLHVDNSTSDSENTYFQNNFPLPEIQDIDEPYRDAIPSHDLVDEEFDANVSYEEINNEDAVDDDTPSTSKHDGLIEDLLSRLKNENEQWESSKIDEESEEEGEEDFEDATSIDGEESVQPGHCMTTSTSVLLIWMYIITHSLTSAQASDLLALINLHLLVSNPAMKSLHHLKKFFIHLKSPMIKHYFCSYCFTFVQKDARCCPNDMCSNNLKLKGAMDFFIELDIANQLSNLFTKDEFRKNLKHRYKRIKKNKDNIEDIYDGSLYRSFTKEGGILHQSNENNISFTLNTDGVPIFKSSKTSIWPIFLMVNELPFRMRKQRENMILCGLWFGQDKPPMNMFFDPFQKSVQKLCNGMEIKVNEEIIIVKAILMCLSCDIPARSAVMNMNQHNGESSCPKCMQKGVNTRTAAGGNIRTFPYDSSDPAGPERVSTQVLNDGISANGCQKTINGMKGISFLMFLPHFDVVKNIGIDYMHMICLGIIRLLLKLWFSSDYSTEDFSMYKFIDVVDARISNIKPSHLITRTPRTIGDHLKFWKAAEVRSWFLFYSVPCIRDLLKPIYFYHYCALLEGFYLLCQSSISENDIARSENLINYFVFMVSSLYGEQFMTLNIHSLLHLPQMVRELGPLWSYSCFAFEGANGDLLKMFHGTMFIDIQIVNAVHVYQTVPMLAKSVKKNVQATALIKSLTKKFRDTDSNVFKFFGKCYSKKLSDLEAVEVCRYLDSAINSISMFRRAIIRGIMYHSQDYTRVSMRNSYTVKYIDKDMNLSYGFVLWFAQHHSVNDAKVDSLVCISKLKPLPLNMFDAHSEKPDSHIQSNFMNITLPFLHFVTKSDVLDVIPLTSVLDLCICIQEDNYIVICEEPNHHELNL